MPDDQSCTNHDPAARIGLQTVLEGQKLVAINRVGKQLYFEFANSHVLSLQLMLYGSMHWYEDKNDNKFTIAELLFSDGTGLAITNWQKAVILSLDPEVSKVPDGLHLPAGYLERRSKEITNPSKRYCRRERSCRASEMLMWMRSFMQRTYRRSP